MTKRTLRKGSTRLISVMLSVLLIVNTLGLSAFAAEGTASTQQSVTASGLSDPAQYPAEESNEEPAQASADESDKESAQDSEDEPDEQTATAQDSEDEPDEQTATAQNSEDEPDEQMAQNPEDESDELPAQDSEDESDELQAQDSEEESKGQLPGDSAEAGAANEEQLESPADQKEGVSSDAAGAAYDKGSGDRKEMSAWASLQAEIDAAENGDLITVTDDIRAESGDSALMIPRDKKITLDLKGTLDRGLDEKTVDGCVIINMGDLTITGGGTITGGNTTGAGGGIWNYSGALTLDGVRICNNHAGDYGGGVYSEYGNIELIDGEISGNSADMGGGFYVQGGEDAMTMSGGRIKGNSAERGAGIFVQEAEFRQSGGGINENLATYCGGGVYLQYSTYEMTGGSINSNQTGSSGDGGGVYIETGTFTMEGGTINNNLSDSGGAVHIARDTFVLAGGTITGNESDGGAIVPAGSSSKLCIGGTGQINVTGNMIPHGDEFNVYLKSNRLITVEKAPVAGSKIGITTDSQPTYGTHPETNYVKFADLSDSVNASGAAEAFSSDKGFLVYDLGTSLYLKYNRIATWSQLQDALDKGGEQEWFPPGDEDGDWIHIIRLTDDIKADSYDRTLLFQHPATSYEIILDLCGHTIDRGLADLTDYDSDGYVLHMNGGDLVIRDSVGGGKITGGNSNRGGGIYIESGNVTLESGEITGNRAFSGGGVYIGGGALRQTGGSITGNRAYSGGGIYVESSDTYEISGTPVVTDNEDEYDYSTNVFLNNNAVIRVTGGLEDGAKLGIGSESAHTVTSGYADYYDGEDPVGRYFINDHDYLLYFDKNSQEVGGETDHDIQLVWTWPEEDGEGQATLERKCVNCGEVEWTETTDIEGPGEYSEEEGAFEFTATVTHGGETYSDKKYKAPERVEAVVPYIDEDGEYHSGMEDHYVLKFGDNAYYYEVNGDMPGEQTGPENLARDLFLIDGETICSYCGELGDEETVITLPKAYSGTTLKYIGDGSNPFYDSGYDKHVTIDVTYMTDSGPEVAPNAFTGREDVRIIGPHACRLRYGDHDDETGRYTVEYSDDHFFEAIDELTEWNNEYTSAVIHIQCIRESCCFYDIAIEETTVTSEVVNDKIEYFAAGSYNGLTYTVSTIQDAYTVHFDSDNGTGETAAIQCLKTYRLPGSEDIGEGTVFTVPAGTSLTGWRDENGSEYAPSDVVELTSSETTFTAVWSSEWDLVNSALQDGKEVTLRNDITATADDSALTVPAGVSASLDFNGFKADRGLTAPVEDGYVLNVDGKLNLMSTGDGGVKGLITGGYNSGDGGGVYVAEAGNVDITGVDIKSNHSSNGAGVYVAAGGVALITGSAIMYNIASGKGGGAFVSESARLYAEQGTQIIENVAQDGAGVYIETGGQSTFNGTDVKVKNNTNPNGDFNNIKPQSIGGEVVPVVISGSFPGMFLGFSIGSLADASAFIDALFAAALGLDILGRIIFDVSNKSDRKDQEDDCDHPSRIPSWNWNSDYTQANANLVCNKCGHTVNESDINPFKSVGPDGVTTYTAHVEYNGAEYEDEKTVDPYIVTLKPGEQCHADPVTKTVPHDKNRSGSCTLEVPANFVPEGAYIATSWADEATQTEYVVGDVLEVDKDKTLTLIWTGGVFVTYKKGVSDPQEYEPDIQVVTAVDQDYYFLPCRFTREDYDFTKWKVYEGDIYRGDKAPGEKLKPKLNLEAIAQWQSKWTTLGDEMKDTRYPTTVIDLKENVTALEGDTELLVPEGKAVTLNMNGYTLDRCLTAAAADGCVIRVKGTLILNGPGTLKGGFSTDSASGIILESGSTLKISDALTVTGNGAAVPGDENSKNVYIPENAKIMVTGALNGAKIGITTEKKPKGGSPVVFTDGLRNNGSKDNFVSDDSDYKVSLNENGEAVLITQGIIVNGVTGSFNDKIKLNYYFDIPDEVLADQGAYITLTNDRTKTGHTLLIKDAVPDTKKGRKFSIPLAAKEAGDDIIAKAFDGNGHPLTIKGKSGEDYTSTGVKYTLMQYFDWLKAETSSSTPQEKAVGAAAKDYCTAAMIYFNYHAEGLSVSSAVDEVTSETLQDYVAGRSGTLPQGVSIKGIAAMLESDNTLRLYYGFKGVTPTDFRFAVDGNTIQLSQRSDGMYYLALPYGVYSNVLQKTHTYSITCGTDEPNETNTYTITASVLTYARSCAIKDDNKAVSDLGKALYLYNQAAVEAFGE